MRDGTPLPGKTPAQLVSLLAHRVLGPLRPHRVLAVLDYHGLRDAPATTQLRIADRYGVSPASVANWVAAVKADGTRLPLNAGMAAQISRRSRTGEDHLGRTRTALTFGLSPPQAPHPLPAAGGSRLTLGQRSAARTAVHVLATVGPLSIPELLAAVRRTRLFREQQPTLTGDELAKALRDRHATLADGRWHAPAGTAVPARYRLIAAALTGRELRRHELIEVLVAAGYTPASARGRIVQTHPLITRTGPNRYRLIQHTPSASTENRRKTRSMDQQPNSTHDRSEPARLDELVTRGHATPPIESGMPDLLPDVDSLSDS